MEEELGGCPDTPSPDTPTTTGRALLQLVLRVSNSQSLWFNKFSSSWPLLHVRIIWAALQKGMLVFGLQRLWCGCWSAADLTFLEALPLVRMCSQDLALCLPYLWVAPKWESGKVKISSSDTLYRIERPVPWNWSVSSVIKVWCSEGGSGAGHRNGTFSSQPLIFEILSFNVCVCSHFLQVYTCVCVHVCGGRSCLKFALRVESEPLTGT